MSRAAWSSGSDVITLEPADYTRAAHLVEQTCRPGLGAVDACVIAVAGRRRVTEIATLDQRHFTVVRPAHVAAFTLLPGRSFPSRLFGRVTGRRGRGAGRLSTVTSGNSERPGKASGPTRRLLALVVALLAILALIVSGAAPATAQTRVGPQPIQTIFSVGPNDAEGQTVVGVRGPPGLRQASATGVAAEDGTAALDPAARRVTLRQSTKSAIQDAAPKTADGDYIDPNTGQVIPQDGPFDYGHKPGYEWPRTQEMARGGGWSRQDVIEYENDPGHYQIEDPGANRGHRYEMP